MKPLPKRIYMDKSLQVIIFWLVLIFSKQCISFFFILGLEDHWRDDHGREDPGRDEPGRKDPSPDEPGGEDPSPDEPGGEDPGWGDPGPEDPIPEDPLPAKLDIP